MSSELVGEISIKARNLIFAARRWGSADGLPVLALHGWLDNAATFDRLAPCLQGVHLIAIDLVGHGHSHHRPPGVKYHYVDYVDDVVAIAEALELERFGLLGHSMGAGISSLVAGVFPERVSHLMLIEGIGPMSRGAENTVEVLSRSIRQMSRYDEKKLPVYPDFDAAVAARIKVGDMQSESVQILVQRNLKGVPGGVMWRSDPRLKMGSSLYMMEEQVQGVLKGINAPTLLIQGEQGLLVHLGRLNERTACIDNIQQTVLKGGHHLHLDDPEPVAAVINRFVQENSLNG